jgi:hypothetical protein
MRAILISGLLCCCGFHVAAASPGRGHGRASVDLELRPCEPGAEQGKQTAFNVEPEPEPSEPKGAYVGPVYLDGRTYAGALKKLPTKMKRGMGQPVGPSPLIMSGALGGGMYARF